MRHAWSESESERYSQGNQQRLFQSLSNGLQALVSVYKKILEFYKAACEILARKGARLITKLAFENARLPNIIQDFLRYAETLHRIVQTAIVEILDEISHMLCDNHSKYSCT